MTGLPVVRGGTGRRGTRPAPEPPDGPPHAPPGGGVGDARRPDIDDLYHHSRLDLVRLALFLVDDVPTAEDVVQDAFAALLRRHGPELDAVDAPEAYLRTSVVNAARSVLRRRRTVRAHVPERPGHGPSADEYVLLREEHRTVLHALRRLTRRQREVLVLRYWSGLTEIQIADTLGLSPGTVKSTASRALTALRRHLEVSP
ncbi:RNA polymerase sigma factor [Streptomyces marincola]|uniref:SigE family RNA polymerase sigma factor n=1 Tax=Streptomyces marincola TaxID=2878388 RepID=A0A1W7CXD5_9ACTN|nr:SigE family RNA polymerase sigma factor [Streptomyces marincola]ARQ69474.1 SigE family RNA polymerase sigma factor [Streptomyces marincola]